MGNINELLASTWAPAACSFSSSDCFSSSYSKGLRSRALTLFIFASHLRAKLFNSFWDFYISGKISYDIEDLSLAKANASSVSRLAS